MGVCVCVMQKKKRVRSPSQTEIALVAGLDSE
jgi:hypothetical protein